MNSGRPNGRNITLDQVEAWVRGSCAVQGVALKVVDADVIGQVAALLGHSPKERTPASRRGRAQPGSSSESPGRLDSVGVKTLSASDAGTYGRVVEHCANNCDLSTEDKILPLGVQPDPSVQAYERLSVRST